MLVIKKIDKTNKGERGDISAEAYRKFKEAQFMIRSIWDQFIHFLNLG